MNEKPMTRTQDYMPDGWLKEQISMETDSYEILKLDDPQAVPTEANRDPSQAVQRSTDAIGALHGEHQAVK